MRNHHRYNDYYLVLDEDMDAGDSIEYILPDKKCSFQRIMCILFIVLIVLALIAFIVVFVVFPIGFMKKISWQQNLVFTHWNQITDKEYYKYYHFPGLKNYYVPVKDIDSGKELSLGLWHMLPLGLTNSSMDNENYDFAGALKNSKYGVLLYFHGTGEDRSQSDRKYQLLRYYFHVIAFDYRSYGDSTKGELYERNVVNDCMQIFKWLQNKTDRPIYVWGHSLGTALGTRTVAQLQANITGLILEAPFTNFKDELYHHPMVKYFRWLPWFEATVVKPLEKNGFIFNTSQHILKVNCPILFLHAEDDEIVPYFMSEELYKISMERKIDDTIKNKTKLIFFDKSLQLNHYSIIRDPYVILYIDDFIRTTSINI